MNLDTTKIPAGHILIPGNYLTTTALRRGIPATRAYRRKQVGTSRQKYNATVGIVVSEADHAAMIAALEGKKKL